jgi:hypothetical protein
MDAGSRYAPSSSQRVQGDVLVDRGSNGQDGDELAPAPLERLARQGVPLGESIPRIETSQTTPAGRRKKADDPGTHLAATNPA